MANLAAFALTALGYMPDTGPHLVVLNTGTHVWIEAHLTALGHHPTVRQVRDPRSLRNHDDNGMCILSVPHHAVVALIDGATAMQLLEVRDRQGRLH